MADLRELMHEAAMEPGARPDIADIGHRARRRARRNRIGATALAIALLLGGGWVYALVGRQEGSSAPVGPVNPFDDGGRIDQLLVPEVMVGRSPDDDVASGEALAKARAVTVAFHGLLFTVGYDLDYKDIRQTGDGSWALTFLDGVEPKSLRRSIANRRAFIHETSAAIEQSEDTIVRLRDEIQKAEADDAAENVVRLRSKLNRENARIQSWTRGIPEIESDLRRLLRFAEAQEERGGPFDVELAVVQQREDLVVEEVLSRSPRIDELKKAEGYGEPIAEIDAWGVDYYNARFARPGEVDDVRGFEASGFWTGPIPTSYEEKCLLQLVGENDEIVYRQEDIHDVWQDAPPSEDRRDGWSMSIGLGSSGVGGEKVTARFRCEAR